MDFVVPNEISNEYREEIENNNSRIYKINRKGNIPEYMMELYQLMKNNGYDIVHIHGNSSTMLIELIPAVLAHIPVRMVHSHNTTCSHLWLHRLLLPVFNKCYTERLACGYDAGKWLYGEKTFFELKSGIDTLNSNSETIKSSSSQLNDAAKTLSDGANTLSDGMKQFDNDGINTIYNFVNGDVKSAQNRVEKLMDLAKNSGSYKYVLKVDNLK